VVSRTLCLALLLVSAEALAQSMYVSDELVVTLRAGPSTQYSIVRNLRSGNRMDVLESDAQSGYSRVRITDGTEGWVLSRYLTEQPIARERLASAERGLAEARSRIGELEANVALESEDLTATRQRLEDAETANAELTVELASIREASANAITLRDQNESLRRRLSESNNQLGQLEVENAALRNSAMREWFVVGAGVLLGGIVLGLVMPSLRRKRRSAW